MTSNAYYTIKTLGRPIDRIEKFIFGILISSILFFLLLGPFWLFSSASPLVGYNPVISGKFDLSIQIDKQVTFDPDNNKLIDDLEEQNSFDWHREDDPYKVKIHQSEPYKLLHIENPYLQQFSEEDWRRSIYSKMTETREFEPRQVQYCIWKDHSEQPMNISPESIKELDNDLLRFAELQEDNLSYLNVTLQLNFNFMRKQPLEAREAKADLTPRKLFPLLYYDCITSKELAEWTQFDCGNIKDKSLSHQIIIANTFKSALVLGQSEFAKQFLSSNEKYYEKLHDLKLTYYCDKTWDIQANLKPHTLTTVDSSVTGYDRDIDYKLEKALLTNPATCQLKNPNQLLKQEIRDEIERLEKDSGETWSRTEYFDYKRDEGPWTPMVFTLFNMKVATGLIAAYTPLTLLLFFNLLIFSKIRMILIFDTWTAIVEEVTMPKSLIKLVDCCYMMRHEENLIAEEECYRMLQEIARQPELFKLLSGTSLAGSMHPGLDHLTEHQRKKLALLDKFERKGWDVTYLQNKIKKGERQIDDDD